jgi:hypothetical protein
VFIELGPVACDDVRSWSRFARRLVAELRLEPAELEGIATDDFLNAWTRLIEKFDRQIGECGQEFRWSTEFDDDQAEYLLHGLERGLRSPALGQLVTATEMAAYASFTLHLVQALVDGLIANDRNCEHYCDLINESIRRGTRSA